ncbi:ABC transporter ATP-binding protein [Leptolyngbya sp. GGD]|uniref:ABC transporter ATP-binding protein n=1 Tax=Leptolyngbya sp. GGD TaxID=2997907 RepID=UPI00227C0CD2|nr:ABC transporter ATP-binding protein [Leptolyngbya sp. GGD]MCY6490887.1 ABC transporter ATP-binding protein [Leptolyngbya sp. GGD]
MQIPLLETQQLTGGYGDRTIVQDIHLSLIAGEWLSLVGANGSGKSTLLRLLSRILTPTHGAVLLDGKAIHQQPPRIVAQRLSLLPQQQTIPEGLTVEQLVALGRSPHQAWWQWELNALDQQKVRTAIEQTQLQGFIDRPVEELSGGERQRAFLALALAQEPKILLLDEPTTYLDVHYQLELLELLRRLNRDHQITIITVLHELNLAARYSDRIGLLKEGYLNAMGQPNQVFTVDRLAEVFGIQALILDTPVGLQICPLHSLSPENSLF